MIATEEFQVRREREKEADDLVREVRADALNEALAGDLPIWEAAVRRLRTYEAGPLSSMQLGFLRDGRLRVQQAIQVTFTHEAGVVLAEAEGLDEYGEGSSIHEAIADLQRRIAALYFALEEQVEELGPGLRQTWSDLNSKIAKR